MDSQIIQQGAEALILKEKIGKKNQVIKRRIKKSYRIKDLDEKIRASRTRSEAKLLAKASRVISVPEVKKTDESVKEIIMDFINGKKLSEHLDKFPLRKQKEICKKIGESAAKLHNSGIIHGDLTTSNMILVENTNGKKFNNNKNIKVNSLKPKAAVRQIENKSKTNFKIFFIDFGLGFISHKIEDKAVDLHLLREALEARHFKYWKELFTSFLLGYENYKDAEKVLQRLKAVEKRGRYKLK